MSTLRANTVSNSAGTGSPAITGGELSRARFNLNGTGTIAERGSFNIASYVDNGTGDYTSNFATAFPNANYSATHTLGDYAGGLVVRGANFRDSTVATSSLFRIRTSSIAADEDSSRIMFAVHGDRP